MFSFNLVSVMIIAIKTILNPIIMFVDSISLNNKTENIAPNTDSVANMMAVLDSVTNC